MPNVLLGVKYGTGKHDGTLSKVDELPAAKVRPHAQEYFQPSQSQSRF